MNQCNMSQGWGSRSFEDAVGRMGVQHDLTPTCFLMQFPGFLGSFRMGFSGRVADDPRGVLCIAGCLDGILGHCIMNEC